MINSQQYNNHITGIHHIGYLVKNLDDGLQTFLTMGYKATKLYYDANQMADICFMNYGNTTIELVCPHKDSYVYPLLNKFKNSPYHICYTVDNISRAIADFRDNGCIIFKDIFSAPAISDGAQAAFLLDDSIGMFEIVEI